MKMKYIKTHGIFFKQCGRDLQNHFEKNKESKKKWSQLWLKDWKNEFKLGKKNQEREQ